MARYVLRVLELALAVAPVLASAGNLHEVAEHGTIPLLEKLRAPIGYLASLLSGGNREIVEEALKKLESIVESMESDELPLETLLSRFEEGTRLAKVCQAKLAEAELKIQRLEKNAAGEPVLKPLDAPAE